jgi:very-short-patch-repair endonuclease
MLKPLLTPILTVFILAAIAATLKELQKKSRKKNRAESYTKTNPLSKIEQILYWRLIAALPDHVVLAQVGLSRCVKTTSIAGFNTVSQKSLDFVICDKSGAIVAAIELDDITHELASRIRADKTKDRALQSAGIPIIRWHVKNLPESEHIKLAIEARTTRKVVSIA